MTTKLNKKEREKENLVKEIERALHALVSTDVCPLPMQTPEEIESQNIYLKNIADEFLKKEDESKNE